MKTKIRNGINNEIFDAIHGVLSKYNPTVSRPGLRTDLSGIIKRGAGLNPSEYWTGIVAKGSKPRKSSKLVKLEKKFDELTEQLKRTHDAIKKERS